MYKLAISLIVFWCLPHIAYAQERGFKLNAPNALVETGFLKHLLPRFSLKTGVRITLVESPQQSDARFNTMAAGLLVFGGPDHDWYLDTKPGDRSQFVERFADWLVSDVGKRTIEAFKQGGSSPFIAKTGQVVVEQVTRSAVTAVKGEKLSLRHCGRCHVVNETNRMNAIGSTPSFALLRSFADWKARFQTFYVLNPHPAFTQVEDVTEPFSDQLPPPISPLQLTLDDIGAIVDYATTLTPADLGAPIRHQ